MRARAWDAISIAEMVSFFCKRKGTLTKSILEVNISIVEIYSGEVIDAR
jgi:hypothetical protein